MSAHLQSDLANDAAPVADVAPWAAQAERSNLTALRVMRWIATVLGRRIARLMLYPIALYFLCFGGEATRHSVRYLAQALGRAPRWGERYRHIHHFAATILDRVYFLRNRLDHFDVDTTRSGPFKEALAKGRGVLLVGAHFGSFEALRAFGESRGDFHVAMVMYEENARLINATLKAVAPDAQLNTISLGRLDAMLSLRKWLDDGGVAGLLADRAPAAGSNRATCHTLPFLGRPAMFCDGPFRLAALLRREVVFMVGLYLGGRRYELRFLPVADFSQRSSASLDAQIAQALSTYASILEGLCREMPYNWFNFFDFWAPSAAANDAPRPANDPRAQ